MEAKAANLLGFLRNPKQFVIPIYQRTYSWTRNECAQLWDDIMRASNDDVSAHFVGSIVYIEKGLYQISTIPQLMVIDGQQRLTTLALLLCALRRAIGGRTVGDDISHRKLTNYYLVNSEEEGDLRHKLLLTQSDRPTLMSLVEEKPLPRAASKLMVDNLKFFEERMAELRANLEGFYKGLTKLVIVDISLNRDHDNPQLIFESLNSTGLALSQADLIRNYILMGQEPDQQERLYQHYWFPIEQAFRQPGGSEEFDDFVRHWLTIRLGRIPVQEQVYEEFKAHTRASKPDEVESLIGNIRKYSDYYARMAFDAETDKELRQLFRDMKTLKVNVAYPLLLELYDDYSQGKLEKDDFQKAVRLVESYVFRRSICGIPTNSLNKTFAGLLKEVDRKKWVESLAAALQVKDGYRRFPTDAEFAEAFLTRDCYSLRTRDYLLSKLENHDRRELVDIANYSVEHIMPQNENLSLEWQEDLGENWREIQQKYLHTLGNLTLTGYNPSLSDKPFLTKRNEVPGGFRDTPIRLSADLRDLEHWNEEEILKRGRRLAKLALNIWEYPGLPAEVLERYRSEKTLPDKELEPRHLKRREFWEGLLAKSRSRTDLFSGRTGTHDNWISFSAGLKGLYLHYVIRMDRAYIRLYIDPEEDATVVGANTRAFQQLLSQRAEIEADFGEELDWEQKEGRRVKIIRKAIPGGGLNDEDEWDAIQDRMIDAMIRFDEALRHRIANLQL